ncbi:hypothetical protein N0V82_006088 [Gnomoniopsis sp. IMI 355080]|nr:hypothetical protein N0V82_006088 [Gnomoniopsis sp. IMI 355080]
MPSNSCQPQTPVDSDRQLSSSLGADRRNADLDHTDKYDPSLFEPANTRGSIASERPLSKLPRSDKSMAPNSLRPQEEVIDRSLVLGLPLESFYTPSDNTKAPGSHVPITQVGISQPPSLLETNFSATTAPDPDGIGSHRDGLSNYSPSFHTSNIPSTVALKSSLPASPTKVVSLPARDLSARRRNDFGVEFQPTTASLPRQRIDEMACCEQKYHPVLHSCLNKPTKHLPILDQATRPAVSKLIAQGNDEQAADGYDTSSSSSSSECSNTETRTYKTALPAAHRSPSAWHIHEKPKVNATQLRDCEHDDCATTAQHGMFPLPPGNPGTLFDANQVENNISDEPAGENNNLVVRPDRSVPTSLSGPAENAFAPNTGAERSDPLAVFDLPEPGLLILWINQKRAADAAVATATSECSHVVQGQDSPYASVTSQGEKSEHVHRYRPNLHTVAALIVEERNTSERLRTGRQHGDSRSEEPKTSEIKSIDTTFIPRTVQQHAESQKKRPETVDRRNAHRTRRSKKQKKTGRVNKERLCTEKVLQSANEDAEHDLTGEKPLKKKTKRRQQRTSHGLCADQQLTATAIPAFDQTCKEQVADMNRAEDSKGSKVSLCSTTQTVPKATPAPVHGHECAQDELGLESLHHDVSQFDVVMASERALESAVNQLGETLGQPEDLTAINTVAISRESQPNEANDSAATAQFSTAETSSKAALLEAGGEAPPRQKSMEPVVSPDDMSHAGTIRGDSSKTVTHDAVHEDVPVKEQPLGSDQSWQDESSMQSQQPQKPGYSEFTNAATDESCNVAATCNPPELVVASPSSSDTSTNGPPSFDVEAHVQNLFKRSMQQQQQYHITREAPHQAPFCAPVPPAPVPNTGGWPHYAPETLPNYYHPIQPAGAGLYPFPDQLPEYFPAYYDYEPYAGFPQPQYYEPLYGQSYGYGCEYPARFEQNVSAASECAPTAEETLKPEGELDGRHCWEQRELEEFEEQKPWYLQPLVYEEEKEREFEAQGPSQRMRLMKVCRKYGL